MNVRYAFLLPPQVLLSKKLSCMQKMIIAYLFTTNKDVSIPELAAGFMEPYEQVEGELKKMIDKKLLVEQNGFYYLANPFFIACKKKGLSAKKEIREDKENFDKVKNVFLKVFPEVKGTATDKKAMSNLMNLAHRSAPAESWERYLMVIKKDEFHKSSNYIHVTLEYCTRPKTIDMFWKLIGKENAAQPKQKLTLS